MTRRQKRPIAFLTAFAMVLSLLLYLPGSVMTDLGFGIAASAATITPSQPSGDGSEGSPYQIGTAAELYWFAAQVNSGNTTINADLTADITVNTGVLKADGSFSSLEGFTSWTPIGNISNQYTGSFNGNDHTISGLFFYDRYTDYVGLFGYIGNGGRVSNVGVVASCLYGADYVGGISGCNNGTIESCYNASFISSDNSNPDIGGVCGKNYGTIKNCYNRGKAFLNGVCGYNYYGTLENCYNAGTLIGTSYLLRGVCGSNNGGTIKNCYYLNTSVSDVNAIGKTAEEFTSGEVAYLLQGKQETAVWGQNIDNGETKQAYPVLGGAKVYYGYAENDSSTLIYSNSVLNEDTHQHNYNNNNGFCTVCGNYEPAVKNSSGVYEISNAGQLYWFAQRVNSGNNIKAILTKNITVNEGDVAGCKGTKAEGWKEWTPIGNYSSKYQGTFDGQGYTVSGLYFNNAQANNVGLFGYIGSSGSVSEVGVINSYINGKENVGGVCGYNGGTITSCYNTVAVSGTKFTGGVCGYNNYGTIKSCYNTGTVSGTGNFIGGVCGYNNGSTIENSYNTGAVSSTEHYVGGVCGESRGSNDIIRNCYNTGAVSGNNHVGGVCGENETGTVTNCYNTGAVSGKEKVGDVCGTLGGTIANCYFDSTAYSGNAVGVINGGTVSDNVLGKSTAKFASGEVCYLLNNGITDSTQVWYQTLGSDSYPLLDNSHGTVYQCTPCTGVFSNTEGAEAQHSYIVNTEDSKIHICENCGDTHNAVFTANDTTDTISVCCDLGSVTLTAPTEENLTYDGTEKAATVTGEIEGFDTPKIFYKEKVDTGISLFAFESNETAPINVGTYTASITYTDEEAAEHTVSVEYTIKQAELTVEAGTYKVSKGYDGTVNPGTGSGEFKVTGLVGEDSVTIKADSIASYSSAEVGESNVDVEISLTYDSGNYKLKNTTVSVPAEITPRSIIPICLVEGTYTYTGSPIIPNVIVQTGGALGGGQPKVYEKDKDYTITVTDNINAGKGKVTFKPVSGGNYTFDEQTVDFTIGKGTPTITAAPTAKANLVYTGKAQELISAGTPSDGTMVYSLTEDGEYSAAIPKGTNAGNYTVYYKVLGDGNVNDSAVQTVSASIGKANVTVRAKSHTVKVGNQLPTFGYDVSGLVNNEALPITVSVSCSVSNSDNLGTFPIRVSGDDESTNYIFTYVNGSLTIIAKTAQTITADNVTLTYSETGKKITASTSGDGDISYVVKTGDDVITVAADGTITTLKVGTATVEITAAETDDYAKATKTITVTVNKAKPSVTAPTASAITLGQTLADSTLSDSSWSWSDSSIQPTSAGTHSYTAVKTVDDTDYYDYTALSGFTFNSATNTLTTEVSVEVRRAGASVTPPTASNTLTYGQALSAAGLTEGWTWESASTIPDVNNTGYTAYKIVTDYDNLDYSNLDGFSYDETTHKLSCTVAVTVNPTAPTDATTASQSFTKGTASTAFAAPVFKGINNAVLTGSVSYTYGGQTYTTTATLTAVLDSLDGGASGTISYTFTPTSANYTTASGSISFSVIDAVVTGITLKSAPTKTTYEIGDTLDLTGGKITVSYNNGTSADIDITAEMISGFDSTTAGEKTVTVTYSGFTTSFKVTVSKGSFTVEPQPGNMDGAEIDMPEDELNDAVLTPEDKELIEQGVDIAVLMTVITINPETVPANDVTAIDNVMNDFELGCYIDVELFKRYSNGNPDVPVTDTNAPITISFKVPADILTQYPVSEYEYSVFCSHNGVGYPVTCSYNAATNVMSFSSTMFSTYALAVKSTTPAAVDYTITADSHVTVQATAQAEEIVSVTVEDGYKATVTNSLGAVITTITGTGSFVMPESNVTITSKLINTHVHNYSTEWNMDSTSHWHECDCGEKSDVSEHISDGGKITVPVTDYTNGVKTYSCTVCGYVMETETIFAKGPNNGHYYPIYPVIPTTSTEPGYTVSAVKFTEKVSVKTSIKGETLILSWNKISNADKYYVYQYKNGKYVSIKSTANNSVSLKGLKNGESYQFLVRYVVDGKLSPMAYSGKSTVKVIFKPYPKAVADKNSVKLSWKAVPKAEKYAVYKYVDGKAIKLAEVKNTSVKINKLSPDTEYSYIVSAYVDGEWTKMYKSDIVTVRTLAE